MFPKAIDYHKSDSPLIPNGLGILYVLASAVYLFLLHFFEAPGAFDSEGRTLALALASCILFGGFMGLADDWMDLRWRYKAFLPLFATLPLAALRQGTPSMAIPIFGVVNFAEIPYGLVYFYVLVIPVIVTGTTNTINQLGGLNGLETICPLIIMLGLMASSSRGVLLYVPMAVWALLAYLNFKGKIFVGNTGSFAVGITLASYAIIANDERVLLISLFPYIFNSMLKLLNIFIRKSRADLKMYGDKLRSDHRRSLPTLLAYYKPLTERQLVLVISLIVAISTALALVVWFIR